MKVVPINGIIGWDTTGKSIKQAIADAKGEDIRFEIHSPGGSIFDGIEIFNAIRSYTGKTEARITGIAASMASYIALAANKVSCYDNAVYMIHNARTFNYGDQNTMREIADFLEKLSNLIAKEYVKKTGASLKEIKSMMDDETFLYGDEIKEKSFCDEVLESGKENTSNKEENIVQAKLALDNCMAKLKEEKLNADELHKVAAVLSSVEAIDRPVVEKVKVKNEIKVEGIKMTLAEMLKEHPELAAEIEALGTEKFKSGVQSVLDKIKQFSGVLMSSVYPENVKTVALACVNGEKSVETATEVVAQFDSLSEAQKTALAKQETKDLGGTKGEQHEVKTDNAEALFETDKEVLGMKNAEVK